MLDTLQGLTSSLNLIAATVSKDSRVQAAATELVQAAAAASGAYWTAAPTVSSILDD
jgi:hypothetical protein